MCIAIYNTYIKGDAQENANEKIKIMLGNWTKGWFVQCYRNQLYLPRTYEVWCEGNVFRVPVLLLTGEGGTELESAHAWRRGGYWARKYPWPEGGGVCTNHQVPIMHCSYLLSVCSPNVKRKNWRLAPAHTVKLQVNLGNYTPPFRHEHFVLHQIYELWLARGKQSRFELLSCLYCFQWEV